MVSLDFNRPMEVNIKQAEPENTSITTDHNYGTSLNHTPKIKINTSAKFLREGSSYIPSLASTLLSPRQKHHKVLHYPCTQYTGRKQKRMDRRIKSTVHTWLLHKCTVFFSSAFATATPINLATPHSHLLLN